MYTGIIQAICTVKKVNIKPGLNTLGIAFKKPLLKHLKIGASVAVDGVCLTVTAIEKKLVFF